MFSTESMISTAVLNTLPEHLCLINVQGKILFVNKAWINFEHENSDTELTDWLNINYLEVCDKSAKQGDTLAKEVALGIRSVANEKEVLFKIEYPCHSPKIQRWFSLNCTPFTLMDQNYLVLQHSDITKKIEANINSNIDALTSVGNRRAFNEFLDREWRRCKRLEQPISAILIDIDNFKEFNDTYGHVKGDECLNSVSHILKKLAHRPSDIFCRYGGEEFVYILGNTETGKALELCEKIHHSIRSLQITHTGPSQYLTVSIGTACVEPKVCKSKKHLIELADNYLYQAKSAGKNTTRFHSHQ